MNRASENSGTYIKVSNIQVTGVPEGEEKEIGTEKTFWKKKTSQIVKDIYLQIQEIKWISNRTNSKKTSPDNTIQLLKTKDF